MSYLRELVKTKPAPLLGMAAYTYDPAFVEIAGLLGYDVIWIEMEHMHISFDQAADLCRMANGMGMATMIRIPDASRQNVLRAAECAPDIIDLPMANSPEIVRELAQHARYAPRGNRGFFGSSRASKFGYWTDICEEQRRINDHLCLMGQIETKEAAERVDEICAEPELDAILIGPGDLSSSLGVCGQTNHPVLVEVAEKVIKSAKSHGKIVTVACPPADAKAWTERGADLLFCGANVSCLRMGLQSVMKQVRE